MQKKTFAFLWENKTDKIKRPVLPTPLPLPPLSKGGSNLHWEFPPILSLESVDYTLEQVIISVVQKGTILISKTSKLTSKLDRLKKLEIY